MVSTYPYHHRPALGHRLHPVQQQIQQRLLHQLRIHPHHQRFSRSIYHHDNLILLHLGRRQLHHNPHHLPAKRRPASPPPDPAAASRPPEYPHAAAPRQTPRTRQAPAFRAAAP